MGKVKSDETSGRKVQSTPINSPLSSMKVKLSKINSKWTIQRTPAVDPEPTAMAKISFRTLKSLKVKIASKDVSPSTEKGYYSVKVDLLCEPCSIKMLRLSPETEASLKDKKKIAVELREQQAPESSPVVVPEEPGSLNLEMKIKVPETNAGVELEAVQELEGFGQPLTPPEQASEKVIDQVGSHNFVNEIDKEQEVINVEAPLNTLATNPNLMDLVLVDNGPILLDTPPSSPPTGCGKALQEAEVVDTLVDHEDTDSEPDLDILIITVHPDDVLPMPSPIRTN